MKVQLGRQQNSQSVVMLSVVNFSQFAQSPDGTKLYFAAGATDEWMTLGPLGRLIEVDSYITPVVVLPAGTEIVLVSEK